MNDYTVNDVALCSCRRWKEPRFEVFERETVIRCELHDVVVSHAVDIAAQLIGLVVVDERDALIADVLAYLIDFDLMRAIRLVFPLSHAQIKVTFVDFVDVVRPPVKVLAYRVQLSLAMTIAERVAEMLFEKRRLAVPWVRLREHSRKSENHFLVSFHICFVFRMLVERTDLRPASV